MSQFALKSLEIIYIYVYNSHGLYLKNMENKSKFKK